MDTSRASPGSAPPPPTSTFPLMPRKGSFQPLSHAAAPSSAASFIPLSHQLAPGPMPALLPLPRPHSGKEREGMLYPPPLLPPRHHQFVPLITVPSLPPRANNPNFENRDGVDRGIESPGYGDGAERVMLGGESFDAYPAPPPVGSSLAPLGLQKQETLGEGMILPLPPKRSQALVSPPAPPAPGVISSCYKKRKRDLGADYESILLVIKAVCRTASHGFVYMDVEDKKGANTAGGAGQGHGGGEARPGEGREGEAAGAAPSSGGVNGLAPTLKLGHSLYEFIVRVLGESCLGKRRLTEAGFWLSL